VPSVGDAVTLDGKLFQTRGAATKKALHRKTKRDNEKTKRKTLNA